MNYSLLPLILACIISLVRAAAYNLYQYDLTVPQFTPDGRLLQVEYASAAADHSFPILVAPVDRDTIVLISARVKNRVQERLIVLPESDTVVAIAGIVSDCSALLQRVHEESLEHRRLYGTPLVAQQVVQVVASACQQHAFGGGLRCYGSTMVVCGCQDASIVLLQADPSGALLDVTRARQAVTVIGGASFQGGFKGALERSFESLQDSLTKKAESSDNPNETIASRITKILRVIGIELERSGKMSIEDLMIEVAVVSSSHGAYKLNPNQVSKLLSKL